MSSPPPFIDLVMSDEDDNDSDIEVLLDSGIVTEGEEGDIDAGDSEEGDIDERREIRRQRHQSLWRMVPWRSSHL